MIQNEFRIANSSGEGSLHASASSSLFVSAPCVDFVSPPAHAELASVPKQSPNLPFFPKWLPSNPLPDMRGAGRDRFQSLRATSGSVPLTLDSDSDVEMQSLPQSDIESLQQQCPVEIPRAVAKQALGKIPRRYASCYRRGMPPRVFSQARPV